MASNISKGPAVSNRVELSSIEETTNDSQVIDYSSKRTSKGPAVSIRGIHTQASTPTGPAVRSRAIHVYRLD